MPAGSISGSLEQTSLQEAEAALAGSAHRGFLRAFLGRFLLEAVA